MFTREELFTEGYLNHKSGEYTGKIFKESLDLNSKEFHASVIAQCFFTGRGGFLEQSNLNAPKEECMEKTKEVIYNAALAFFKQYPASLYIITKFYNSNEVLRKNIGTLDNCLLLFLRCTSLELGNMLAAFWHAKNNHDDFTNHPLHDKYKNYLDN